LKRCNAQDGQRQQNAGLTNSPTEPKEEDDAHDVEQTWHVATVDGAESIL
jgi:hypothetical protein